MKNFKIIAAEEVYEDGKLESLASLKISEGKKHYATIWADNTITFNSEIDFGVEDVEFFLRVASMYTTFFNNLKN